MPETTETLLLIAGVVFILAGLAGGTVRAFNVEVPAIRSRYSRIGLVAIGAVFSLIALWMILRPSLFPYTQPSGQDPSRTSAAADESGPAQASDGAVAGRIGLGQTVTGTLYYNEANSWLFNDGPTTIDIFVDVGPYGEALIMVFDPQGVQREYVDAQTGREERLMSYSIPSDGNYTIAVRNLNNTQVNYRLSVRRAGAGQ